MITRIWHGRTKKENSDNYRQYIIDTGIPEYLEIPGNLDTQILQRDENGITHFWAVTQWDNFNSIKSFAGKDIEKAKYYPDDEKYLLEMEPEVIHCQTFPFANSRIKNYIRQFEQLCDGSNWNDESYTEKLKAIDAQIAFTQPAPDKHSVAEIVWHVIYWRTILIKKIQGDYEFKAKTMDELNFLPLQKLREKGWKVLLAELKQTQELLISLLKEKDDGFLSKDSGDETNFDYHIEGLIHHDIYHLGQIGLVISILSYTGKQ